MSDPTGANESGTPQATEGTPQGDDLGSLDQVYEKFGVQPPAPSELAAPQQPAALSASLPSTPPLSTPALAAKSMPNPTEDPEGYVAWVTDNNASHLDAVQMTVSRTLSAHQEAQESAANEAKVKADVNAAVKTVMEVAGQGAQERWVKGELLGLFQEDSKFASVFENRGDNPEAFAAALKVIGQNFAKQLPPPVDPQLKANQQAQETAFNRMPAGQGNASGESKKYSSDDEAFRAITRAAGGGLY